MKMGLMFDFRNPPAWHLPNPVLYKAQLDQIVLAEKLGYDNAWLTEHHFNEDSHNPAPLACAAAAAVLTSRIRIGTFVLVLPFHHPARVAEDATCVDILSNGRFDLGVGQGYRGAEFESFQVPRRERAPRMTEGIELIKRLWTEDKVNFDGKYTKVTNMTLAPKPVQQPCPPIWVGCRAEKASARAARLGYHLMATLGPDPAPYYRAQLKEAGRDPKDFFVAQLRTVYVAPTADQAWADIGPHIHHMMTLYGIWLAEANDVDGDEKLKQIPPPDKLRDSAFAEGLMIGSVADVTRKMEAFKKNFDCTHFVMSTQAPGLDPKKASRSMELFAKEIMPGFQSK